MPGKHRGFYGFIAVRLATKGFNDELFVIGLSRVLPSRPKHPFENRIHMFGVIAKVKLFFDLIGAECR